jgi:hypothetical protein
MAGKIFYRERVKTVESKQSRYILAGVSGVDLKIFGHQLSMSDLKYIADQVGAELLMCPAVPKHIMEAEEEVEV